MFQMTFTVDRTVRVLLFVLLPYSNICRPPKRHSLRLFAGPSRRLSNWICLRSPLRRTKRHQKQNQVGQKHPKKDLSTAHYVVHPPGSHLHIFSLRRLCPGRLLLVGLRMETRRSQRHQGNVQSLGLQLPSSTTF